MKMDIDMQVRAITGICCAQGYDLRDRSRDFLEKK